MVVSVLLGRSREGRITRNSQVILAALHTLLLFSPLVKGRIHCSADTARLLPKRWLELREDKIVAKGKGEMTT